MNRDVKVPTWIRKRDGRLAPFDPDRICQALFAASERLGQPNAFLARELTDSIVHFLAQETTDQPPTTSDLAEVITKVVREMGHPALAQSFAMRTRSDPDRSMPPAAIDGVAPPHVLTKAAASIPLSEISLTEVFPRNLVAAHREGILTLTGLEHPFELAGTVINRACDQSRSGMGIHEAIEAAREYTGNFVAIDGPDYALAQIDGEPHDLAREFAIELSAALRSVGLSAIVNLGVAQPPDWARDLSDGPLFAEFRQTLEPARVAALAEALLSKLLACQQHDGESVSLAWHLSSDDFMPDARSRLQSLARIALDGGTLEFIFDRPRKPVALGGGLTRREPALLLAVGVHLPRLIDARAAASSDNYLAKVGTLARLARSAGHAKQDFLRRRGRAPITNGFLLDRARLLVVPVGLEFVVRELTSQSLCDGGAGTQFGVQIVRRLREALSAGKRQNLEAVLDAFPRPLTPLADTHILKERAGLQVADAGISPRHQLHAATALRVSGGSMATLAIPAEPDFSTIEAAALLQYAWTQTEISRLRFERAAQPGRQLSAPWEGQDTT